MADIQTVWDVENSRGDWNLTFAGFGSDADLTTSVLISLFTDRTASADDTLPDRSEDPRGWWGDLGADRPIGSKLWLRMREKQTEHVRLLIEADIVDALRWLIDDGVATSVDVDVEFPVPGMVGATVLVNRDEKTANLRFDWAWQGVN